MALPFILAVVAALALGAEAAHAQLAPSTGGRTALAGFNRLDRDGDRALTLAELRAAGREGGARALFDLLDGDGDGRVAVRELGPASGALLSRFDAYDADKDGFVSRREFPNFVDPRLVAALDRDGDRRLALGEIRPAFAGARARTAPAQPRKPQPRVADRPGQAWCWITGFGRDRWTIEAPVAWGACRTR